MAQRRYGVTRFPRARAQPVITKSAKAPKLQEDKRMHASGFYEPEAGEVRKEIAGITGERARGRHRRNSRGEEEEVVAAAAVAEESSERTYALSKCATLCALHATAPSLCASSRSPLSRSFRLSLTVIVILFSLSIRPAPIFPRLPLAKCRVFQVLSEDCQVDNLRLHGTRR